MLMDADALAEQAALLGRDSFELALEYQELGLSGIILYEETPETLAAKGRIIALLGHEFTALTAIAGVSGAPVLPRLATVLSEIEPGALDYLLAKAEPAPQEFQLLDRTWYWFPGDSFETRPAGPDRLEIERYAAAGFDI